MSESITKILSIRDVARILEP